MKLCEYLEEMRMKVYSMHSKLDLHIGSILKKCIEDEFEDVGNVKIFIDELKTYFQVVLDFDDHWVKFYVSTSFKNTFSISKTAYSNNTPKQRRDYKKRLISALENLEL